MGEISRIPVCGACLRSPEPLEAEFYCSSCRAPFRNGFPLDFEGRCALCRSGLRGFDAAYCYAFYEGTIRRLIQLYKYGRVRTLAAPLADLAMRAFPRQESLDAIVPVPLFWRRRWERGFNQSALVARAVARRTGLPLWNALARIRPTAAQAGLSNHARRMNVEGAFRARRRLEPAIRGRRILLIDDVMTTGATAAACASALKRAGARHVALLTIARVDRRMDGLRARRQTKRESA